MTRKKKDGKKSSTALFCACRDLNDILIVDDNVFNILTLQTMLEEGLHLKSDRALNGKESLNCVEDRI